MFHVTQAGHGVPRAEWERALDNGTPVLNEEKLYELIADRVRSVQATP
jgi:hypothetical protein